MEATFGKLDRAKLCFGPGLSVIEAPNEWGKSTWCAFLTAMLYGVDTRERSTKAGLSVKEKYAPWSGKPMEGRMVVEHHGMQLTLERKSGRSPMGEFRAYETESGLPVPGLSGENCGEWLLGVPRSVFLRSAFVRFQDLPVEADDTLRRRLNALVTTGDESGRAELLGGKLSELKRKIQFHKTGLLPESQEKIALLRQQLQEVRSLGDRLEAVQAELNRGRQQREALETHLEWLDYDDGQDQRLRLEQAAQAAKDARAELEALEDQRPDCPEEQLRSKLRQGSALREQMHTPVEIDVGSRAPAALLAAAAALVALAGLVLMTKQLLLAGLLTLVGGALVGLLAVAAASRRRDAIRVRNQEIARRDGSRQDLDDAMEQWQRQIEAWQRLAQARTRAEQAKQRLQDLLAVVRTASSAEQPRQEDTLELSRAETESRLARLRENLRIWQSQTDQLRGQMEVQPRQEVLERQLEEETRRRHELERHYRAIGYAQGALETASQELQRRFVPQITRRAAQLLSVLTEGRYTKLSIGEDLALTAASEDEMTLRGNLWRSEGTSDQMYLALRLAVWEAVCPEAPLVLDDALVRFDEQRLQAALALFRDLGRERQILLFSCRRLSS